MDTHYDAIIIGSGFGGSVSALRLTEKGYRVLVLEKGRRFHKEDFAETNRDLKNWMWNPSVGQHGIFSMSFFKHVTVLHGVGVGGGSLGYANTLPTPSDSFFESASWEALADWKNELAPHYATAKRMLGATPNPRENAGDRLFAQLGREMGRAEHHHPTEVGVHFGEPGKQVSDPYFGGKGPDRVGCTHCGSCMTGCRVGAKNTLDRNYLYLAEQGGAEVLAETEVTAVREGQTAGYRVETRASIGKGRGKRARAFSADKVIFSGGVMGTLPLLLQMKEDPDGLPRLSDQVGKGIRTNSEALISIAAPHHEEPFNEGVTITSILHTDDHSHVEPVIGGDGSDFFRFLGLPHVPGDTMRERVAGVAKEFLSKPRFWAKAYSVPRKDFMKKGLLLLYMRTLDGTLSMELGRNLFTGFRRGLVSVLDDPAKAPKAFMPEATAIAERAAEILGGAPMTMATETLLGSPTTAHVLGGACMGVTAAEGVIDAEHRVHGYDGLYVIDGSAMSANPGVNPSLTITALAERAMQRFPARAKEPQVAE